MRQRLLPRNFICLYILLKNVEKTNKIIISSIRFMLHYYALYLGLKKRYILYIIFISAMEHKSNYYFYIKLLHNLCYAFTHFPFKI